jgi:colicin import membrane protein
MSFIRQHKGAVVWSLALHVAVAAVIAIGLPWRVERPRVPVAAAAPIQGVIIDQAAIERERAAREEAARQERQQQQRAERQRREAAEQQRVAAQREQQRIADVQRVRDEDARKEAERVAAEKAAQQRREEQARAEREAQAKREREEADKRARELAEQRRRQAAEAELQAQVAAEAEANAARQAGLYDQYIRAIESKIKQEWNRPLSARPGLDCLVRVVQVPTGDVMSVEVGTCNGDDAVRRSIEQAVRDASPLPKPPHPSLFDRNLNVTFRPEE